MQPNNKAENIKTRINFINLYVIFYILNETVLRKSYFFIKKNIVSVFFLILVVSDAFTKVFHNEFSISKYVKAFLLLCLVFYSVYHKSKLINYVILALVLFTIGSLSVSITRFTYNLPQFFEYYFALFYLIFLQNKPLGKLKCVLEYVFIAHAAIIITSAVLELQFLKTYPYSARFGYTSLFNSQNEFSFIMISGIAFFTVNLSKNNYFNIIKLIVFLISSLLVGTKAIFIFLIFFYSCLMIKYLKPIFYSSIIASLFIIVLLFQNRIILLFKTNYKTLYDVYRNDGLINFLSSNRYKNFFSKLSKNSENLDFINYLFGSYDLNYVYELALLDILGFFGAIGALVYFLIIKKYTSYLFIDNFKIKTYGYSLIFISMGAGYLFENASAQVYTLSVFFVMNGLRK